jgi:hypothetical protein
MTLHGSRAAPALKGCRLFDSFTAENSRQALLRQAQGDAFRGKLRAAPAKPAVSIAFDVAAHKGPCRWLRCRPGQVLTVREPRQCRPLESSFQKCR